MKAQFAMIESVLSLFAILSAVSLVASQANANALNLNVQKSALQRAVAVYDIMNVIEANASANSCVFSSSGCKDALAAEYSRAFGIGSMAFALGGSQSNSSYENSTERCLPVGVLGTNETIETCVTASG